MTSATTGQRLPAAHDRIDIAGVQLHAVAAPAGALGGDHRRAAAEKAIEHNVAAGRAVQIALLAAAITCPAFEKRALSSTTACFGKTSSPLPRAASTT